MMRNSDAAKYVAKLSASARLCNGKFGAFSRTTFAIFLSRSVLIWIDIPQIRQRKIDIPQTRLKGVGFFPQNY
jgi:hypothetical protein